MKLIINVRADQNGESLKKEIRLRQRSAYEALPEAVGGDANSGGK